MLTLAVRGFTIVWPAGSVALLLVWAVRWHRVTRAARAASTVTSGRLLDTIRRLEGHTPRIRLLSSNQAIEPGVFGIVRPELMWPAASMDRLSDEQIEAILAHEVAHVRRRDNLAALIHMLVEAVFWFHPLVWWIGARLVDERERACDEDVVGRGTEPDVYAESILKTCQFYIESPLVLRCGRHRLRSQETSRAHHEERRPRRAQRAEASLPWCGAGRGDRDSGRDRDRHVTTPGRADRRAGRGRHPRSMWRPSSRTPAPAASEG